MPISDEPRLNRPKPFQELGISRISLLNSILTRSRQVAREPKVARTHYIESGSANRRNRVGALNDPVRHRRHPDACPAGAKHRWHPPALEAADALLPVGGD